jgi:ElaB/YqjD/DUF883 family membrane-anchored ribosome-binding protein
MASTDDLAPSRANNTPSRSRARSSRASSRNREAQLEEQVSQLQTDLKAIGETLTRLTGEKVEEAKSVARTEARHLQKQAQHVIEDVQEQAGEIEDQLKRSIREKPLTAVAAAAGIGFLFALLTRR